MGGGGALTCEPQIRGQAAKNHEELDLVYLYDKTQKIAKTNTVGGMKWCMCVHARVCMNALLYSFFISYITKIVGFLHQIWNGLRQIWNKHTHTSKHTENQPSDTTPPCRTHTHMHAHMYTCTHAHQHTHACIHARYSIIATQIFLENNSFVNIYTFLINKAFVLSFVIINSHQHVYMYLLA